MEPDKTEPTQKGFKKILAGLIILALLLGGGWYLYRQGIFSGPANPQNLTSQPTVPQAQVAITSQGFVPQTILIQKGSSVIWTNKDIRPHQIASDPHPTHSLLTSLGQGKAISPKSTFTFTFNQTGTFTYHDELNPLGAKGEVIVK